MTSNGFEAEEYRKYTIKSGLVSGKWSAQAFLKKQKIGNRTQATSREQSIQLTKDQLDAYDSSTQAARSEGGIPTVEQYRQAFDRLGPLAPSYEAMLDAHLTANDTLISASQLADAAGYKTWSAANLHYGTLGKRLAEELDYNPPTREDGSTVWTYTLATAGGEGHLDDSQLFEALMRSIDDPHFEWLMRKEVIEVLKFRN